MTTEMSTDRHRRLFDEMYSWFEDLCREQSAIPAAEVARFWTDDGRMIMNGAVEAAGLSSLQEHFDRATIKYQRVIVRRPYHVYVESGDRVVIEYEVMGDIRPGEAAFATGDTSSQHVRVIAVFTMRDGRIAEMREVAATNLGDA